FGYGQERYFWSLLAAFGIFIAGAGFSIFEGLLALNRTSSGSPLLAYLVLAAAGLAEGISPGPGAGAVPGRSPPQPYRDARPDAQQSRHHGQDRAVRGLRRHGRPGARRARAAPAAGDRLAGLGRAASIAIGVLLIAVAVRLGLDNREYLIGRSADPR